jgi:hypothetical protein
MSYIEKYFMPFREVFENSYDRKINSINDVIYRYLNNTSNLDNTILNLQELTGDFEYTPFKWILHHIRVDYKNQNIVNKFKNVSSDIIVYKQFEKRDYGFNLLSDIYERKVLRLGVIGNISMRSRLFRLSTLINNEDKQKRSLEKLPIIGSTIFESHKYCYSIYDHGILTVYTKGEIWDKNLERYVIPKLQKNRKYTSPGSISISQGEHKVKYIDNADGSNTSVDEKNNAQIEYLNGCIETNYSNGVIIIEYPDGSIERWDKNGQRKYYDFEGNETT